MKFTNQEIINTLNALNSIAEKDFPIQMTYKIIDLQEKLMNSYQTYEKAKSKVKNEDELLDQCVQLILGPLMSMIVLLERYIHADGESS